MALFHRPTPAYLVAFYTPDNEVIAGIKPDGTVEMHREGAAPEAARLFYEVLQIEGRTLRQEIERLTHENDALRNLGANLRPGPISEVLGGVDHEQLYRTAFETSSVQTPKLLAAEINALPQRVRDYIHHLETDADPAGDKWQLAAARENTAALAALLSGRQSPEEPDETAELIERAAGHWLKLQLDFPIAWEGGIDAAMQAACNEIRRLRSSEEPSELVCYCSESQR